MYERSQVLARILASVTAERKKRRARTLETDRTLRQLPARALKPDAKSYVCFASIAPVRSTAGNGWDPSEPDAQSARGNVN
jgi:hypothetical protein